MRGTEIGINRTVARLFQALREKLVTCHGCSSCRSPLHDQSLGQFPHLRPALLIGTLGFQVLLEDAIVRRAVLVQSLQPLCFQQHFDCLFSFQLSLSPPRCHTLIRCHNTQDSGLSLAKSTLSTTLKQSIGVEHGVECLMRAERCSSSLRPAGTLCWVLLMTEGLACFLMMQGWNNVKAHLDSCRRSARQICGHLQGYGCAAPWAPCHTPLQSGIAEAQDLSWAAQRRPQESQICLEEWRSDLQQ